jgi:hypothetical protein
LSSSEASFFVTFFLGVLGALGPELRGAPPLALFPSQSGSFFKRSKRVETALAVTPSSYFSAIAADC